MQYYCFKITIANHFIAITNFNLWLENYELHTLLFLSSEVKIFRHLSLPYEIFTQLGELLENEHSPFKVQLKKTQAYLL